MNILANIISLTIVFAVPLMLVALGGMYSEHSGVINLALEGIMVIGALCACFTLQGFDRSGFDRDGYDREGYDSRGFDSRGYDRRGYDEDGLDSDGCFDPYD